MRGTFVLISILLMAQPVFADFIDFHDRVFRNQNLCDSTLVDQVEAEQAFKEMFVTLKSDDEEGRKSNIEVMDFGSYSTRLKDTVSGANCSIILHDDCYSAFCE